MGRKRIRLVCLALLSALHIPLVLADRYPGDATYTAIVQEVYHEVSADNIGMSLSTSVRTREQLCDKLIDQHNNATPGKATITNAQFIGITINRNTCLNALWYSSGYNGPAGFSAWAGTLQGTWFDATENTFSDPAIWNNPRRESTKDPQNDLDANGEPRVYDFQEVVFDGRLGDARFGWNQSHPEVAYVWGWDPKDNLNQSGRRGTHVGWSFTHNNASCIIWVTPEEAFVECIKPVCTGKKRTSAGLFGIGQWTIGNTKNCRSRNVQPFKKVPIKAPHKVKVPIRKGIGDK